MCVFDIRCCEELKLRKNVEINVEIQFQMNSLIFAQMHYAIDQLDCVDLLFPDQNKIMRAGATGASPPPPQSVSDSLTEGRFLVINHSVDCRAWTKPDVFPFRPKPKKTN